LSQWSSRVVRRSSSGEQRSCAQHMRMCQFRRARSKSS
jgi:hypothetical protein